MAHLLHKLALKVICHHLPQCWCNQSAWEQLALWEAGWAAPCSIALGSCLLQGDAAFWVVFAAVWVFLQTMVVEATVWV